MEPLASTPAPPYYAVVFTRVTGSETDGYASAAARMIELAADRPGFLGVESADESSGVGITVSYWTDEAAIAGWRDDVEHIAARDEGRRTWYDAYELRVARVERAYGWRR